MIKALLILIFSCISISAFALGIQPETTVLVLNQENGDASISVKNTNNVPTLLQTKIVDVEEGSNSLVLASPSIVKIDAGESQIVRFFLKENKESNVQQIKRIRFIGLPARNEKDKNSSSLSVAVGQSIPLIINPAGLKPNPKPWEFINYHYENGKLFLSNPSQYIVRLYPEISADGVKIKLQQSFIAPKSKIEISYKKQPAELFITPVGLYGELREKYSIKKAKTTT